jgi:hypothetical protein
VAFWEPKTGTARSEWEDGCAYSPASGWFAVTDGASAGTSSREWAYALALNFVADRPDGLVQADEGAGTRFLRWISGVREGFDPDADEFRRATIPEWVRKAGGRRGAFSTLLGGRITAGGWAAVAIGDCCLFHVRASDGTCVTTFPLSSSDELGATPQLIPTVAADDGTLAGSLRLGSGSVESGDLIFAATDAMAAWMLRDRDRDEMWRLLGRIGAQGFAALCQDLRERSEIRDDDVTLLRYRHRATDGGDS